MWVLLVRVHGDQLRAADAHGGDPVDTVASRSAASDDDDLWGSEFFDVVRNIAWPRRDGRINHGLHSFNLTVSLFCTRSKKSKTLFETLFLVEKTV
jgi:hypothetical protein